MSEPPVDLESQSDFDKKVPKAGTGGKCVIFYYKTDTDSKHFCDFEDFAEANPSIPCYMVNAVTASGVKGCDQCTSLPSCIAFGDSQILGVVQNVNATEIKNNLARVVHLESTADWEAKVPKKGKCVIMYHDVAGRYEGVFQEFADQVLAVPCFKTVVKADGGPCKGIPFADRIENLPSTIAFNDRCILGGVVDNIRPDELEKNLARAM
mmetsp:Transcript_125254/g.243794  ORF Transcript_125254/g.243794 Transcript_125254/m.243794 type:complete len:209 (+) Transcript_125254:82-708(+)